jgi:flagellar biosynthesis protein FlhB
MAAGILANYLQVGFLFSTESLKPTFSKIDPIKGFKKLFSIRAMTELVKNILKICIIGTVAYVTVQGEMEGTLILQEQSPWGILSYIGDVTFKIILRTCWPSAITFTSAGIMRRGFACRARRSRKNSARPKASPWSNRGSGSCRGRWQEKG